MKQQNGPNYLSNISFPSNPPLLYSLSFSGDTELPLKAFMGEGLIEGCRITKGLLFRSDRLRWRRLVAESPAGEERPLVVMELDLEAPLSPPAPKGPLRPISGGLRDSNEVFRERSDFRTGDFMSPMLTIL